MKIFNKNNKALFFCLIATILFFVIIPYLLFKTNSKQMNNDNTLIVGMMNGWPPFMSIDTNGTIVGFDVDVAQEIARRMKRKLVINDLGSLSALFIALDQGKISMIFSGLDITKQRLQKINMVRYTGEDVKNFTLLFYKNIPKNISSIKDFKNNIDNTICVESGSGQERFLDSIVGINKKCLFSVVEMIMDIKFSKSKAAILEPSVAKMYQRKDNFLVSLPVPLPKDYQVFGCGIALKKDSLSLTNEVNNIITAMRNDGSLKILEKKWEIGEYRE